MMLAEIIQHTHTHVTLTPPAKVKAVQWCVNAVHHCRNRNRTEDVSSSTVNPLGSRHLCPPWGIWGSGENLRGGRGGALPDTRALVASVTSEDLERRRRTDDSSIQSLRLPSSISPSSFNYADVSGE